MPIQSREDVVEVEARIARIFAASPAGRTAEIRRLFVETLDFTPAAGQVPLHPAPKHVELPSAAERISETDGVHVLYVALDTPDTDRVRKTETAAATRLIADQLGEDLLLLFTNRSADQLHLVHPSFEGARPTLRRMIVERDLPRRTAVQQVSNIYWERKDTGSIRTALDRAFDVDRVTREFFEEYSRVFDHAMEHVQGFGPDKEEQERKKMFVQTLFNRLMFVYFVSRKGWLTFGGNNEYLSALWKDYAAGADEDSNFHYDRLRLLFFAGLNNLKAEDLTSEPETHRLIGKVPFLNGGLFDKTPEDDRSGLVVPDDCISCVFEELFEKFNFTVMESTPFDIEVAVDPEMLGKVFEELVIRRHDTGSYYTPRPVVSFMCREALKGYLEGQDTGLDSEAVAGFVDVRDTSGISQTAAPRIAEALENVTVVDPACGSGAYLLGMMQELVDLRTTLFNVGIDPKSLYELKLHIIQRNLYGVDIDEFAVNIAMLRMWLALAVEYEGDTPEPLPNLDFKILQGDSLLGPDPSPENYGDLFRHRVHEAAARLASLKAEHMKATTGKEAIKAEIVSVEADLRDALADTLAPEGAVDWRVQFAEVFDRDGFDIAIANPPYIQLQKDAGKLGKLYKDVEYTTFVRTGDVYQLFYERGCQLLRSSRGLLAYITSNSWLKAEYGKPLRRYFSTQHTPLRLLELGKDVFASAIVDSGVLLLRAGSANGAFPAVDMDRLSTTDFPPRESLWGTVRPDGEAPWSVLSRTEQSVMDKMLAEGTPLGEWDVRINRGVITGYNKAFIIDDATRRALIAEDPNSERIIKPILRGRDIRRYRAKWAGLWLIVAKYGSYKTLPKEFPAIHRYLLLHEDRLRARGQCRYSRSGSSSRRTEYAGQHHWLELDNNPKDSFLEEFTKEKLFWMDLTEHGRFAYHDGEMFCANTAYVLTGASIKYLCAVLNSILITWFMKNTALNSGMGTPRWVKFTVERLLIPKISAAKQRPFVRLVDEILEAKATDPDADTSYLEWDIDRLVYDLYGLTDEEDTAIERSLGLIHETDEEEDAALATAMDEAMAEDPGGFVSEEVVMATLRGVNGG